MSNALGRSSANSKVLPRYCEVTHKHYTTTQMSQRSEVFSITVQDLRRIDKILLATAQPPAEVEREFCSLSV